MLGDQNQSNTPDPNLTLPDLVDGFTYSMSMRLLPTTYRALALSQMEPLRRALGYTSRWYTAPDTNDEPITPGSQAKYQLSIVPGSYIWGLAFSATVDGEKDQRNVYHVLITDACSELALFSDYVQATNISPGYFNKSLRGPMLLPQPRLISNPGLVNVEVYSGLLDIVAITQLVLYCAEPREAKFEWAKTNRDRLGKGKDFND